MLLTLLQTVFFGRAVWIVVGDLRSVDAATKKCGGGGWGLGVVTSSNMSSHSEKRSLNLTDNFKSNNLITEFEKQ